MSCDVSIPSIEPHITPPYLSSKNQAYENKGHSECLHHFFEHPFVLPDSIPDDLVEFPGELNVTVPTRSPLRPTFRKPQITAQPTKSPQSDRSQRVRELQEGSLLLAYFKSHGRVHQPFDTIVCKPLGSLQATHQRHVPRLVIDASLEIIPRPPPQQPYHLEHTTFTAVFPFSLSFFLASISKRYRFALWRYGLASDECSILCVRFSLLFVFIFGRILAMGGPAMREGSRGYRKRLKDEGLVRCAREVA
jgi:hypothetical protein